MLDPEAFQQWFLGFMEQFAQGLGGVVALDGKTLRRSYDHAEGSCFWTTPPRRWLRPAKSARDTDALKPGLPA